MKRIHFLELFELLKKRDDSIDLYDLQVIEIINEKCIVLDDLTTVKKRPTPSVVREWIVEKRSISYFFDIYKDIIPKLTISTREKLVESMYIGGRKIKINTRPYEDHLLLHAIQSKIVTEDHFDKFLSNLYIYISILI